MSRPNFNRTIFAGSRYHSLTSSCVWIIIIRLKMPGSTENVVNCAIWHFRGGLYKNISFFAVSKFQAGLTVWAFFTISFY